MAKTDLSIKIGAEYVGKVAFAKAEKSVKRLGKQVAALALGGGILNFGQSSIKAFYESEKSAKALYGTLNNLNLAYRKDDVNKYIDKLSLATGVVDETLNPAFQQFLLTTRDITKSQGLLGTALDISAGTGYDLMSVTKALSSAYNGNKTALSKMQLGFTKAQLEASSFADIQKALNSLFKGQAASAASGYTGQIDKLNIAIDQLKENVGKGLVTGLSDASGNIDNTAESIARLGTVLGTASGYLAKFAVGWTELFTKEAWTQFWNDLTGKKPLVQVSRGGDQGAAERAAQQRLDKATLKNNTNLLNTNKALLAEQKKQALLKKAQGILDIQQAQILAALQNNLTEDEKKRLALQMALLTDNAAEANRLSNELAISQLQTTQLASAIANLPKALNPFADYPFYVQQAAAQLASMSQLMSPTAGNLSNPFVGKYATNYGAYAESPFTPYSGNTNPINYNITVNGVVGSASDVSEEIRQQLLNQSNTGSNTFVNTLKGIS